jgi:hypothetical protein
MAAFPAAHALQLTISVPDCPGGQALAYNPATSTLSCGTGGSTGGTTPSGCSITQNPDSTVAALAPSTLVTLSANCTQNATGISYSWNIGVIGSSIQVAPSVSTTYTVTPSNPSGPGAPFSTTVAIQGSPTTTPPGNCAISQNPNTLAAAVAAGTTVTLTATCGTGSPVTSCSWTGGIGGSACSVNVAPQQTTTYSVVASNSAGSAPSASTTVTVGAQQSGGGGQNFCVGGDSIITVNWPASGQVRPSTNGFGNQRIAFKITVPFTFSPALNINHLGFVRIAEVPGTPATARDVTVSKNSCDFQSGDYLWNGIGTGDTAPGANFTANNPTGYFNVGASFNVNSGDVFYVNVRNSNGGVPSCPAATCDILFDFATPNRY